MSHDPSQDRKPDGGRAPERPNPLLHVVLHEPEIPNNTGNIGRTCVALASSLHLIHPIGFDLDEKACRRAGLDYWPRLDLHEHESWAGYTASSPSPRRWLFSTRPGRSAFDADLRPGDHLVFGKESAGIPREILDQAPDRVLTYPMLPGERSLNLATIVTVALYDAIRQMVARGEVRTDDGIRLVVPREI